MSNYNFDFDAYQEAMYNPDRADTTRYEQAAREYEESRDIFNHKVSTGRMLTDEEREQINER